MYSVGDVLTTCSLSVSSKSCSQNFLIGKGRLLLQSVWSTHFPFIFFKKIVTYITLAKKGSDILSKSGGNESCRFRAHCDGMIV